VLRVAEQYAGTDTGRQRRANEDSLLARAPLFVVADGMGGARAGEVASRIAVESFGRGIGDAARPADALASLVREANSRIYERSHKHADEAGMGTTLTAIYVGTTDVSIAHVGDSRAYRLRDGQLERLTEDHSLVDELIREGRLTPEEAFEHPQRSVITRALGNESDVEVDTQSIEARAGDVYLLCSDGLTTMIGEQELEALISAHTRLRDVGEALIGAANEAGGRDNITVVLVRVEDVPGAIGGDGAALAKDGASSETAAITEQPGADALPETASLEIPPPPESSDAHAVAVREPRRARARGDQRARGRSRGRFRKVFAVLAVLFAIVAAGAYLALEQVYFVGTNGRGLLTLYRGLPYRLPGGIALYQRDYVTGVSASTLPTARRKQLLDHSWRSEANAIALIRGLELGELE
jgi:PPM family protein phosphatase